MPPSVGDPWKSSSRCWPRQKERICLLVTRPKGVDGPEARPWTDGVIDPEARPETDGVIDPEARPETDDVIDPEARPETGGVIGLGIGAGGTR